MDLDEKTGLVPREQIKAHLAHNREKAARYRQASRPTDFLEGAQVVYNWVLNGDRAPFSGPMEPSLAAITDEEQLARSAIYGQHGAPEVVSQDWAVGIENTCMWLKGQCDEPPEGLLPGEESDPELY